MYTKVSNQTESLKGLWAAKLNLSGKSGAAKQEDFEAFDAMSDGLEAELERRKELGRHFEAVLIRIRELSDTDGSAREEHQVSGKINKTRKCHFNANYLFCFQNIIYTEAKTYQAIN